MNIPPMPQFEIMYAPTELGIRQAFHELEDFLDNDLKPWAESGWAAAERLDETIQRQRDILDATAKGWREAEAERDALRAQVKELAEALEALVLNIDAGGATLGAMSDARAALARLASESSKTTEP